MVNSARVSALDGHFEARRFGADGDIGVSLSVVPNLILYQIAAWPETLNEVAAQAAKHIGVDNAPKPCNATVGASAALLRVEPLKWWCVGSAAPTFTPEQGTTLDISHSRTQVRIHGAQANVLLNRHLPLDLRESAFPVNAVASTAFHHCGVTLWRSDNGYNIFLPRGFALSLWELLLESAAQFGAEIS